MSAALGRPIRAFVVGGGIGGLAAGVALRAVGVDVTVYEQSPAANPYGGGLKLWTNATRALRALGVAERVIERGEVIEHVQFCTQDGRLLADWPAGALGREHGSPTMGVLRPELHDALADALGDAVRFSATFTEVSQDARGVTATFADGTTDQADFLVGADGQRSAVRTALHGATPLRFAGYFAWRGTAELRGSLAPRGVFRHYWGRGRRFVFYPVGDGRFSFDAMANAPEGDDDVPAARKSALARCYEGFGDPVGALIDSVDGSSIARVPIYDLPPLERWGEGRITLLGDAAHPMTPNQGQGAGMALEDAVVLANSIATGDDVVASLREYEKLRQKRTKEFVVVSRLLGTFGRWENPAVCRMRDLGMRAIYKTSAWRREKRHVAYDFANGPLVG